MQKSSEAFRRKVKEEQAKKENLERQRAAMLAQPQGMKEIPLPQKPQNLSQIRKQMKDEKNQKPVLSSPKLSQTKQLGQSKQTNKANELANKAITKAGKEMKGFVKNLFGSDKKAEQKSAEQSRTSGNKKLEQKVSDAHKSSEQQKFVKPAADNVIERTFSKPQTDNDTTTASGQDKKGDVTMMKMIQQRLKTKPKPTQQTDQQAAKQTSNKQTKSDQKQTTKKEVKKEQKNMVPDEKRRASKSYIDSFLPEGSKSPYQENLQTKSINQEIPRNG